MSDPTARANRLYPAAFVRELARAGVRNACICPGSRSTPLALAFANEAAIRKWVLVDERSAGFFALGMAKRLRQPVALLCTSGTAAVNFMPAVVEARYARVPLLILTADRPHELRDTGANQTIDQLRLYGAHAKWFIEMALPEASEEGLRYARAIACRAVARAQASPAGPVHLNFPFREPLLSADQENAPTDTAADSAGGHPYVAVTCGPRAPDAEIVDRLAELFNEIERGLVICGPQDDPELPKQVARLADRLRLPILADALSLMRCGRHHGARLLDAYDAFLRCDTFVQQHTPQAVIRFGAPPTSKALLRFLERHQGCHQVIIDGGEAWNDPSLLRSNTIHADAVLLCESLAKALGARRSSGDDSPWLTSWQRANRISRGVLNRELEHIAEPFEGKVFSELAELLPDGAMLYAGNSMPVRDLDSFFPGSKRAIAFSANRGASGIDGVVSSALGASAVSDGPLVLVIGDLSFYHDLNGLLAAKLYGLSATIVLLHNDGGGIFSFLPQAEHPKHFENLFGTPHGLDFSHAARMYGADFIRPATWADFRSAVREAIPAPGIKIIEVRTERGRNAELHRELLQAVVAELSVSLGG